MSEQDGYRAGVRLARSLTSAFEALWYAPAEDPVPRWGRALALPELVFKGVAAARGWLFDRGWAWSTRIDGARVISVGNLTAGGSGKTPAVIFLANAFAANGRKVFVLSRGYGRRGGASATFCAAQALPRWEDVGDEPLLIARCCPSATVMVGPDRAALAHDARRAGAEVILLDDGMQHRRLARDVDILVVDAAVGFGNGRMLPRGPLREPVAARRRATLIWLVDTGAAPSPSLPRFEQPVVRARVRPSEVVMPSGERLPAESLAGRRVVAVAGIARPCRFTRALQSLGATVVATAFVPDHGPFPPWIVPSVPDALPITTEKDFVRLPPGAPLAQLCLRTDIAEGADALAQTLEIARSGPANKRAS